MSLRALGATVPGGRGVASGGPPVVGVSRFCAGYIAPPSVTTLKGRREAGR